MTTTLDLSDVRGEFGERIVVLGPYVELKSVVADGGWSFSTCGPTYPNGSDGVTVSSFKADGDPSEWERHPTLDRAWFPTRLAARIAGFEAGVLHWWQGSAKYVRNAGGDE